jgi:hypothetical protein
MLRFAALMSLVLALAVRAVAGADDDFIVVYNLIQQADTLRETGQVARRPARLRRRPAEAGRAAPQLSDLERAGHRLPPPLRGGKTGRLAAAIRPAPTPAARHLLPRLPPTLRHGELAPSGEVISQFNALNAQIAQLAGDKKLLEARLREALSAQPAPVDPKELQQAVERISAAAGNQQGAAGHAGTTAGRAEKPRGQASSPRRRSPR